VPAVTDTALRAPTDRQPRCAVADQAATMAASAPGCWNPAGWRSSSDHASRPPAGQLLGVVTQVRAEGLHRRGGISLSTRSAAAPRILTMTAWLSGSTTNSA
jgi:hypothetical protein